MAIEIGGGFRITDKNPIDDRFVVSSSDARFNIPFARAFEGLTVYASSSDEYFILGDRSNWNNAGGWHQVLIGSLGGGGAINYSGSLNITGSLLVSGANSTFTGSITVVEGNVVASAGFVTLGGDVESINVIASSDISASDALITDDIDVGGDLTLSGNTYISKSIFVSESINVTETSPRTFLDENTGSFIISSSEDYIGFSSGAIFIVSTSFEDSNGLSSYEFHATGTHTQYSLDRPDEGIWFYSTESVSDTSTAIKIENLISRSLGGVANYNGPDPIVLIDTNFNAPSGRATIGFTSSYDYLEDQIKVFYRTSSSPSTNTLISTGSSTGGNFLYAVSSSGDAFIKGDILIGEGSRLKTDEITNADYPYTQSAIHLRSAISSSARGGITLKSGSLTSVGYQIISESKNLNVAKMASVNGVRSISIGDATYSTQLHLVGGSIKTTTPISASIISASGDFIAGNLDISNITASYISASSGISASELFVSGDTNMLGTLSLPNIPDVSSSLAAAIEGAGNLETVLTNGNTATIAIEIDKSGVAFSGSGGGHITASEAWFESGSNIGPAEDGAYSDGAFTFTTNTKIGTAVDKMNEALAGLIPAEAPEIQYLGDNEASSFVPARSNLPTTYAQLASTGSLPTIELDITPKS